MSGKTAILELSVKCINVEKGCEWEGTVAALEDLHIAECKFAGAPDIVKEVPPSNQCCYVFTDASSLWDASRKLKDTAERDPRFRINYDEFLQHVTKDRPVSGAFFYGNIPQNHVKIMGNSIYINRKRREQVKAAMAHEILKSLYQLIYKESKDKASFIIISGDHDFRPLIEHVLDKGVSVELWSWKDVVMASEFQNLATTHHLFTVHNLVDVQSLFSHTDYTKVRVKEDNDPLHSIVYKNTPTDEHSLKMLINHLDQLQRLYYIITTEGELYHTKKERDIIIEFDNFWMASS